MAGQLGKLVNKQFNSPIKLYSENNIREVLDRETQMLENGAVGINFHNPLANKPSNLQHSAVLRFLEEEEQRKKGGAPGLKRVAWPPPPEGAGHLAEISLQDIGASQISSPGLQTGQAPGANYQQQGQTFKSQDRPQLANDHTSSPQKPSQSPSYQSAPLSPNVNTSNFGSVSPSKQWAPVHSPVAVPLQPSFPSSPQAPSHPAPPKQQYQQHYQQNQYSEHIQTSQHYQPQQYQPPAQHYQVPIQSYPSQQYQPPPQQFQTPPQQYQPPPQQYQPPPQQYQPPPQQYQLPSQQYQPSPHEYQLPPQQYQPCTQYQAPAQVYQAPAQPFQPNPTQQNQFSPQQQPGTPTNLQAVTTQLSQPPHQQHQSSIAQQQPIPVAHQPQSFQQQPTQLVAKPVVEPPPATITLRPQAPVNQAPAQVYTSQPATATLKGGKNLRGDLKWPPPETKAQMDAENVARVELARGPVCRPRKVKRDYSGFFAQNALNNTYPGYKIPPGTQFYVQERTT